MKAAIPYILKAMCKRSPQYIHLTRYFRTKIPAVNVKVLFQDEFDMGASG